VRELLQNVVKHSQAHQVVIEIACGATSIDLSVRDDGVGFDPEAVAAGKTGFGLFSIRERMASLGGSLSIQSAPGQGSRFDINLPVACAVPEPAGAP
jgi:signal transduction histidine kinase